MMLIPCPWCGPRSQIEFTYGGDATLRRPATDAPASAWAAYVYLRDNPCGLHDELWYHGAGCRSWFTVRRDTRTHDIVASAPAGGADAPGGDADPRAGDAGAAAGGADLPGAAPSSSDGAVP
jgi:methylglutamate dehydrogenase subunit B